MSKIRVHELAKELGRQNREVLNFLADKGFELKSHMSMVEDEQVDMVRKRYGKKAEALKTKVENRCVGHDIIAGTFFIAGDDGGEELISLNEEQIKEYTEKFYEIEEHTQEEMQRKMRFEFYSY